MRQPGKHRLDHPGDPLGGDPGVGEVDEEVEDAREGVPEPETTGNVCSLLFAMVV